MQGVGADPVPGESLPGFVMRVADGLKFDSAERLAGICRLRQPGSTVTSDALIDLAARSGASLAALEGISYRPSTRFAHNAFLGGSVHREFIDISRRRLCPLCLEDSPHHRACWDLTMMTACPVHGIRLIDRCSRSGRRCGPDWKHPDVRRCRCGTDLTSLAVTVVSAAEAEAARWLIALVSGEELPWLPASLGRCERPDLLRLVMTVGMFLTGWTRERRIESLVNAGADAVSAVALAGLHALEEWPRPLHGFLETECRAAAGRPGRYGARKALGAFYSWLTLMEDGETKSVLGAAARDFVEGDPQLARKVHRSRLLTRPDCEGPLVGLNEAAEMLAVSGERVKRLMKSGVLPEVRSEGRGVPMMLERSAVGQLAARNAASLNLGQTAACLGISKSRVRRLVDGGILTAAHSASAENQAPWSFDSGDVASFLGSLADLCHAGTDGAVPVGFEHAVEVLRRRGTDLVPFIRLVLDRSLSVIGLDDEATGLKRLMFDRRELRVLSVRLGSGEALTVQTAGQLLSLKWQVVSHLVKVGLIASSGGRIEVAAIDRYRKDYVSGAELARCHGTSPRKLAEILASQAVLPVTGPGVDGSRQNVFRRVALPADLS